MTTAPNAATETRLVPLEQLHGAPWNPRTITDPRFDALCRSIAADPGFLFDRPILAMADGTVYAGNQRLAAVAHLGWTEVPARLEDVSETIARSRAERDNAQAGDWERELLAANQEYIRTHGGDPTATGFTRDDVARLFAHLPHTASEVPAPEEPLAKLVEYWQTEPGQTWRIPSRSMPGAEHRLVVGDATLPEAHEQLTDGARASMIWTDPPYGVDYTGGTADALELDGDTTDGLPALLLAAFRAAAAVAIDAAPFYVCHPNGPNAALFWRALEGAGWRLHETLVWVKDALVLGHGDMHYAHEPIAYGLTPKRKKGPSSPHVEGHAPIYYGWTPGPGAPSRGQPGAKWYGGDAVSTVFHVARPKASALHPTMKPVELIARQIGNSSRPGEIVLDPFGGSGSTLLAAEQSARLGYLLELDPRYAAATLERCAQMGLAPVIDGA